MRCRVLLVGPSFRTGGVSRFIKDLLNAEIGYEILLFDTARTPKPTTSKGAVGYRAIFAAGVLWAIRNVLIVAWNIVRFPFRLLLSRATLVHITTSSHWSFWENSIYLLCSKLMRRKVILHYLSDFQKFYGSATTFEKRMIQQVFKVADGVIVLSDAVRQEVSRFLSERALVVVVPSSIEVLTYQKSGGEKRISEKPIVLFMGGNYGARKGVYDLISAIPLVKAEYSDVEFWLCGGGDVKTAFENIEERFRDTVKYFGLVDDATKLQLLRMANIYVLPSYSEGMPYGVIEAMACGLPVICTNVGSIPEVVTDGENGLLITPGDINALAKSILQLVKDRNLVNKITKANQEKALRFFSLTEALYSIRRTYDNVLHTLP
jgi:glycosyltransferase involved in cell wall biosynthesis